MRGRPAFLATHEAEEGYPIRVASVCRRGRLGATRSALRCSANNRGVIHERKKTCNARRAARCRGSARGGCGLGVDVHCVDANEGVGLQPVRLLHHGFGADRTNFANTEVEPWVDVNPTNPDNIVATWQQDRWSDGGSRGLVAGVSTNGGN